MLNVVAKPVPDYALPTDSRDDANVRFRRRLPSYMLVVSIVLFGLIAPAIALLARYFP